MKTKMLLLMIAPFVFLSALSAQITQAQADSIVIERMGNEAQTHTIFAKYGVQTEMTITTTNGEILELDYPCFVYYIRHEEEANDKFLIVNANDGNLLEVRTQANAEPEDLAEWRIVIPYKSCDCPEEMGMMEGFFENGILRLDSVYLFKDSIPRQIQLQMYADWNNEGLQRSWVVFDHELEGTNITTITVLFPGVISSIPWIGRICNFPDFAKDWDIPADGIKVKIEGVMYEPCWGGVAVYVFFDLVLTNLKRR